ncbi:MAG: hypothetical protein ACJAVR_001829 [Paracoccaceae bacterium]|jgi:hypothetical protein
MTPELDHLVIGCLDLAAGGAALTALLGAAPQGAGVHQGHGTHNLLWGLGPAYLELIAPDPAQTAPAVGLPFGLHLASTRAHLANGPRLLTWVARCRGIAALAGLSPVPLGPPSAMARGDLAWRLTIPADRVPPCGGIVPGLIEWPGSGSPPAEAMANGLMRLRSFHRRTNPQASAALEALGLSAIAPEGDTGGPPLCATLNTPNGPITLN